MRSKAKEEQARVHGRRRVPHCTILRAPEYEYHTIFSSFCARRPAGAPQGRISGSPDGGSDGPGTLPRRCYSTRSPLP